MATFMNCRRKPEVSWGSMLGGLGFGAFGVAINAFGSRPSLPLGEFVLFETSGITYATFAYPIGVGLLAGSVLERLVRARRAA